MVSNLLQTFFTPSQYGAHVLVVSNKGCDYEYFFNVEEGKGPKVNLNDVEYCKDLGNVPSFIDLILPCQCTILFLDTQW